jgi:ABC-type transporter Mla MlaB component
VPPAGEPSIALDFGALAAQTTGQAAPAPKAPPPKPAAAKKKPKGPVDSILCIEVEEGSGHDIPPAIEEAAILFANGQVEEAHARATKAIEQEELGAWKLQMWLMLFDLLQTLGRKQEFEEKALDFVMKFERSPPAWVDAPTAAARANPSMRTGGLAHVALTGVLGAQSAAALDQLKKAAERQPKLRLDFAKLQSIEPAGCTLLRDTLRAFKVGKKDVYLTGEPRILQLLREATKAGDTSVDAAVWLLLLDLYQMLGMQNEFEEAAVDYAVTYEVSPPSWEAPPARPKPLESSQPIALETGDEAFHLVGEVAGQSDQLFTEIAAYAGGHNPVTLELAAAKRIDFVNAGRLLNLMEKQQADGKEFVIRGAGEMIIALFAVMGITKIARVIPRK